MVEDERGTDCVTSVVDVGLHVWDVVAALAVVDEVGDTHLGRSVIDVERKAARGTLETVVTKERSRLLVERRSSLFDNISLCLVEC